MEANFKLNFEDFWQYRNFAPEHSGGVSHRKRIGVGLGLMGVAFLIAIVSGHSKNPSINIFNQITAAILCLGFCAVSIVGASYLDRWERKRQFESDPFYAGPCTIRLDPHAVFYDDATGERSIKWSAIRRVASEKGTTYLYLIDRTAYIVPRHAFGTEADAQSFSRVRWNCGIAGGTDETRFASGLDEAFRALP